jgi:serine/threonine protein kinase
MIDKIISHYQILEQLGGGGMGVVYRAEDIRLKRPVALKFLLPQLNFDEEAKQRFMQEAQAASALDHPNICTIYEVDQAEDGQMFIAMAYCEGETLKNKISKLAISAGVDFAIQMAQGLGQAHKHGIIHRDIKPANIMITNDGLVKILDFGLAKLAGGTGLTKAGTTMGTPLYMSPEQITGGQVDHRSDIWSLGVVLYEMFAGRLPFLSEYEHAVFYAIVNVEPALVTTLNPAIPAPLERIIHRTLQKRLEDRYASMQGVLDDLKCVKRSFTQNFDPGAVDSARTRTIAISTDILPKPPVRPKPKVGLWIGAAAAALLLIAVAAHFWPVAKDSPDLASVTQAQPVAPVNALKDSVLALRQEMQREKNAAAKVGAATSAKEVFDAASERERVGDDKLNLEGRENLLAAQLAYTEARTGYKKARIQIQRSATLKKEAQLIGDLTVSSNPPGALIYLNGNNTAAKTPHTFSMLEVGTYQIRLTLSGYAEENSAAEVTANQTAAVEATLNPLPPGSLAVAAVISENGRKKVAVAELFVDGQPLGQIPGTFSLAPGSHRIDAMIFGYALEGGARSVTIQSDQKTNLMLTFVKP